MVQTHPRLILVVLGLALMGSTLACRSSKSENEIKRNGEDLLARGPAPSVTDSVHGDAILAGGDIGFSGSAAGDYLGAGGKQMIGGRVHGSLRAAGGDIHVTAAVDRNATIVGGNVELDSAAVVARNVYLAGGNIRVKGAVQGSLLASGGNVVLNGLVGRDVEINAGALTLGPHAQIAGNLRYRVPARKVHIDPAARVSGTTTVLPVRSGLGMFRLLLLLGFLVGGGVVVALVPRFVSDAAEIMREQPGRSALVGLGWLCLIPIVIVIAAITIIGIPLALLTTAVYIALVYLARVPLAVWLGQRVLGGRARAGRQGALLNFLVGGFLLLVVGFIPVIGPLAMAIITILGLGAFLLRVQTLREKQAV